MVFRETTVCVEGCLPFHSYWMLYRDFWAEWVWEVDVQQAINHFQRGQSYAMMEQLGVASLSDQPFSRMSTDEQRRMLLAHALVHEPSTLLLDEPTTGLDVSACFQYLAIIRQFFRDGGTVILVTHHIHEIPPEIERVVLLKDEHIQDDGPKGEVLHAHSLSALFGAPLELFYRHGWFQVIPAQTV